MSLFLSISKETNGKISSFFLLVLRMPCAWFTSANIYNLEMPDTASSHFQAKLKGMAYVTDRSTRAGFSKTVFCEAFRFFKMLSIW